MKFIHVLKNKRVTPISCREDCAAKFSLLNTVRHAQQDRHHARMELAELQKIIGTKSRKETLRALNEFVNMMENGCDESNEFGCL